MSVNSISKPSFCLRDRLCGVLFILGLTMYSTQGLTQEIDVSSVALLSGEADTKLQEFASQAVAKGLGLVVTAPTYWQEMVTEQLRVGGGDSLSLQYRDTIVESVIVRIQKQYKTKKRVVTPARQSGSKPRPGVNKPAFEFTQARPEFGTDRPKPMVPDPSLDVLSSLPELALSKPDESPVNEPKEIVKIDGHEAAVPVASPSVKKTPTVNSETAVALDDGSGDSAAVAQTEPTAAKASRSKPVGLSRPADAAKAKALRKGLKITNTIRAEIVKEKLRPGDLLYVRGEYIVVARKAGSRRSFFWLKGGIRLDSTNLRPSSNSKYKVVAKFTVEASQDIANVVDAEVVTEAAKPVDSDARPQIVDSPPKSIQESDSALSPEETDRQALQKRYNRGRKVGRTIQAEKLKIGDIIYVRSHASLVIRRDGKKLRRYWLLGAVDLSQERFRETGRQRYRVISSVSKP